MGIAMVAYPAVTLLIDLSDERVSEGRGIVYDAQGRHTRGSVVVGLLPGDLRAAGRGVECLQIWLEPVAAAAVLGAAPEVAHGWRRTLGSRGRVRVEALADEVGWSRQLLWARFRSQLGVTPKRVARLTEHLLWPLP
ncbi:hypothetical protein [Streptomyces sp. NPDC006463]|uniref:hypothetical protein n=1 Tax=Streptomyces sp. NPDC006463 TaxID=3364746 RepID=UPI00367D6262